MLVGERVMPDISFWSVKWLRGDDRAVSIYCIGKAILGQCFNACKKEALGSDFRQWPLMTEV